MLFAKVIAIVFTVLALGLQSQAVPTTVPVTSPQFTYNGATGPVYWGRLSPAWILCDTGSQQSPIDLDSGSIARGPLQLSVHRSISVELLNNGHTLEAVVPATTQARFTLTLKGQTYLLRQFHLHTPSEHRVNGKFHDLELHFVWETAAGATAVFGIFYDEDKYESEFLKIFTTSVNASINITSTVFSEFFKNIHNLDHFHHYSGSLTTPPCTEGVDWYVYPYVQSLSIAQHKLVSGIIGFNARFTQAYGGSEVTLVCSS